eukprot:CAMPEP_0184733470 /NCGR_PEP_ID=MMETSP0314-20130426/57539_1 /TAXON_ID=38298 /ORGANISM="Rhodella maculata, Strain CCMP 736" /LENGTH=87 /DNA_ID=CAMNT_0027200293 /DNA_START=114 /DNA_END=374 /DNA_ORIENTATION=+
METLPPARPHPRSRPNILPSARISLQRNRGREVTRTWNKRRRKTGTEGDIMSDRHRATATASQSRSARELAYKITFSQAITVHRYFP